MEPDTENHNRQDEYRDIRPIRKWEYSHDATTVTLCYSEYVYDLAVRNFDAAVSFYHRTEAGDV